MQDITCGSGGTRSAPVTVNFNMLYPPPAPTTQCSLITYEGGLDVTLQWSSSFNSQHAVERYRVSVDPDPSPSCSSDQVVPSEDYSCPGLSPERNYTITVSAINCADQEGERSTGIVTIYLGNCVTTREEQAFPNTNTTLFTTPSQTTVKLETYTTGLLAMGIVMAVLCLAVCTSIGANIFLIHKVKALRSLATITKCDAVPKTSGVSLASTTTQRNAKSNPVMYDEIAIKPATGSSDIPLTQNSAYCSTNRNTETDEHEYY